MLGKAEKWGRSQNKGTRDKTVVESGLAFWKCLPLQGLAIIKHKLNIVHDVRGGGFFYLRKIERSYENMKVKNF